MNFRAQPHTSAETETLDRPCWKNQRQRIVPFLKYTDPLIFTVKLFYLQQNIWIFLKTSRLLCYISVFLLYSSGTCDRNQDSADQFAKERRADMNQQDQLVLVLKSIYFLMKKKKTQTKCLSCKKQSCCMVSPAEGAVFTLITLFTT